jgi:hypothetical protein
MYGWEWIANDTTTAAPLVMAQSTPHREVMRWRVVASACQSSPDRTNSSSAIAALRHLVWSGRAA